MFQHEGNRETARDPQAVADAPRPHVDVAVSAEEVCVGLHQVLEARLQHVDDFWVVFVAERPAPDRPIHYEEADRVVVVGLLQVPSVAGVVGGNPQEVALQQFIVYRIAVQFQERECADVEDAPVVLRGSVVRPLGEGHRHFVLLLLREGGPEDVGQQEQRLRQTAEFTGELVRGVGQVLGQRQAAGVPRGQRVVEVVLVVLLQTDPVDGDPRVDMEQWARQCESALKRFPLVCPVAPIRVTGLRVGLAPRNDRERDRVFERLHVLLERTFKHIARAVDIMLSGHPRVGAQLEVGAFHGICSFHWSTPKQ